MARVSAHMAWQMCLANDTRRPVHIDSVLQGAQHMNTAGLMGGKRNSKDQHSSKPRT
jgi:hypothetical protein